MSRPLQRVLVLLVAASILFVLWCYFLSGPVEVDEASPRGTGDVSVEGAVPPGLQIAPGAPAWSAVSRADSSKNPSPAEAEPDENEIPEDIPDKTGEPYELPESFASVDEFLDAIMGWYDYMYATSKKAPGEIEAEFMAHVRKYDKSLRYEDDRYVLWVGLFDCAPKERLKSVILGGWPRKGLYDLNFLHRVALDIKLGSSGVSAPRRLAIKLLVSKYKRAPETPDFLLDHMYLEATVYGRTFIFDSALKTLSYLTDGAVPERLPAGKNLVAYVHELDRIIYEERPHRKPHGLSYKGPDREAVEKARQEMKGMSIGELFKLLARAKTPRPARRAATELLISDDAGVNALLKSINRKKVPDERFLHVVRALAEAAFSDVARERIIKLVLKRFRNSRSRFQKLTILDQFWWLTESEGRELYELAVRDRDPLVRLKARYVFARIHEDTESVLGDLRSINIKELAENERTLIEGVLSRLYRIVHEHIGAAIGSSYVPRWFSYNCQDEFIKVLGAYRSLLQE